MKHKKLLVGLVILGAVLLSGCTGNNTSSVSPSSTSSEISTSTPVTTAPVTTPVITRSEQTPEQTINMTISDKTTTNSSLISPKSDWCTPGNKKFVPSVGREFTIIGKVTENGIDLCKAELQIPGGKTTYYFSENENISRMNSTSTSGNASASASASAISTSTATSTSIGTNSDVVNTGNSTVKIG